jgi:hypothetical protein
MTCRPSTQDAPPVRAPEIRVRNDLTACGTGLPRQMAHPPTYLTELRGVRRQIAGCSSTSLRGSLRPLFPHPSWLPVLVRFRPGWMAEQQIGRVREHSKAEGTTVKIDQAPLRSRSEVGSDRGAPASRSVGS